MKYLFIVIVFINLLLFQTSVYSNVNFHYNRQNFYCGLFKIITANGNLCSEDTTTRLCGTLISF